jgi:AraC-like DNA-binding protein
MLPLKLNLIHAGAYQAPQGSDFPPHKHSNWELIYYRSGRIRCPTGDEVYVGEPGVMLFYPPGVVHSEIADTAYANFFIAIDAPPDVPWPRMHHDDSNGMFFGVYRDIVATFNGQTSDRDRLLTILLDYLSVLLERIHTQKQLSKAEIVVREAEKLLEARYAEPITITEISETLDIAPSVLRAHFARLRGHSPMARLQAIRVQHALAIINNSDLTLDTIASLCGYDSASHLSRYIKRATGRRPGEFRRKLTA